MTAAKDRVAAIAAKADDPTRSPGPWRDDLRILLTEVKQRDVIIDRLVGFLGVGPHECGDGWHWVYASKGVLEPLTPDEVTYFEDWVFPADRPDA